MNILFWIFWIEVLGLLAFLITRPLLTGLLDRGYGFSKLLGLFLVTFPVWFLGSIHVLPFSRFSIFLVIVLIAVVAAIISWKDRFQLRSFVRREFPLLVITECVFLFLLTIWILFRSLDPAISHTEQLMDFALLNSTIETTFFPPEDSWLRGHEISYYYMGHLMTGLLTKLTGVSSAITYNLSLAFFSSTTFVAVFSLAMTLVGTLGASRRKAILIGLLSAFILCVMGNLEGILELMHSRGVGSSEFWTSVSIKGLDSSALSLSWYPEADWWWWRATRVIDTLGNNGGSLDYTIQEFPFFSSMLGDLHSHFMSTPFVVCTIGLIFNSLKDKQSLIQGWTKRHFCQILLTGLMIGTVGFIDISTIPILLGLAFIAIILKAYPGNLTRKKVRATILAITSLIVLAIVPFLPHYLKLDTQINGISIVELPVTQPLHFAIIWGGFTIILSQYFIFQLSQIKKQPCLIHGILALSLAIAPYFIWLILASSQGLTELIATRFLHVIPAILILAVLIYRILQITRSRQDPEKLFVMVLFAVTAFLLMLPELFYIQDHFKDSSPRMNTVFKTYYHSWVILSLVSGAAIFSGLKLLRQTSRWLKLLNFSWLILLIVTIFSGSYYPLGVSWEKLQITNSSPTLDGLAFLKSKSLGEYLGIQWLKENTKRGDGILEARGNDYTTFGRVSASTGRPTILGWPGHEYQWRGSLEPLEGRTKDIETLYSSDKLDELVHLIQKYRIQYVILGPRERSIYQIEPPIIKGGLLQKVFSQDGFEIYKFKGDYNEY